MKDQLRKLVDQALPDVLAALDVPRTDSDNLGYEVALPKIKAHGDLSVNVAFLLSRRFKKNPMTVAASCKQVLDRNLSKSRKRSWISDITIEKPGFINFRLSQLAIANQLTEVHKRDQSFGSSSHGCGAKVNIEFVSANPTGPLTIAHGRQAAIGDTLARIMEVTGFKPHKEFYLNDAGRQVRLLGESLLVRYLELFGQKASIPEGGYEGTYLIEVAHALKKKRRDGLLQEDKDKQLEITTAFAVSAMLEGVKGDLSDLRVHFDEFFSEKSLSKNQLIEKALAKLDQLGVTYHADGAHWFQSTKFGDDKDRVLKKQTGEYTYLAPDIAYHETKFTRGYERLINLWGPDHHGYIVRLKAACEALGHQSDQLHVLIVQLTKLFRAGVPVRMSTRKGEFVTLRELMDEVGVDATRFFFLMRKAGSHLDFDLALAKEKTDDNPVYYVQYAHARISSILTFAKKKVSRNVDLSLISSDQEVALIKTVAEYPDILKQAVDLLEPYRLIDYLRELARTFHGFYAAHRVVSEDEELTAARLLLTDCARIVLRNGLEILGVNAPKSM